MLISKVVYIYQCEWENHHKNYSLHIDNEIRRHLDLSVYVWTYDNNNNFGNFWN